MGQWAHGPVFSWKKQKTIDINGIMDHPTSLYRGKKMQMIIILWTIPLTHLVEKIQIVMISQNLSDIASMTRSILEKLSFVVYFTNDIV